MDYALMKGRRKKNMEEQAERDIAKVPNMKYTANYKFWIYIAKLLTSCDFVK